MILRLSLTIFGLLVWALAGRTLTSDPKLDVPLNVMGINRSPYGEVIALAIQGPIDQSFQIGMFGQSRNGLMEDDPSATHAKEGFSMPGLLTQFESASKTNTSNQPTSKAHKRYLRNEAEKKLRFAYHLDPSQYSNYNSLHFFLTEPAVGTNTILTPEAMALANETITYCLGKDHDPRPALTAAAACTNILQLMFADRNMGRENHSTREMRNMLDLLDRSIQRYQSLSMEWQRNGNWNLLSEQRINECLDRFEFISKIRDASEKAISHYEMKSS